MLGFPLQDDSETDDSDQAMSISPSDPVTGDVHSFVSFSQSYAFPEFTISDPEWVAADIYFIEYYGAPKFKKTISGLNHSFVNLENEPYAIANHATDSLPLLGRGGLGIVKLAKNSQNELIALKIQPTEDATPHLDEIEVGKRLGLGFSETFRPYGKIVQATGEIAAYKRYLKMKLAPGRNLHRALYANTYSIPERLAIALALFQAVKKLHDFHIIHGDIKPDNFMLFFENGLPHVEPVDFGFSIPLMPTQSGIDRPGRGTKAYMPPEITVSLISRFSFSSDIYSLGKMLSSDLDLSISSLESMTDPNPHHRPNIDDCIKILTDTIHYQRRSTLRNDPEPRNITLSFLNENVEQAYAALNRANRFRERMFRYLGGRGQKRRDRQTAIESLSILFQAVQASEMPFIEKAQIIEAYLYQVILRINAENNYYVSNLKLLCNRYRQEVINTIIKHYTPSQNRKYLGEMSPFRDSTIHDRHLQTAEELINRVRNPLWIPTQPHY